MKLHSLQDLFIHELRDIYDAERQLVKALRKMAKAASTDKLRSAFEQHLTETEGQVNRLEAVFADFDLKPKGRSCEAMKGLVEEGKTIISSSDDEATGDAGLIAAAQKVEHYEIATYRCLREWAQELGHDHAARLLGETLAEEKNANAKLNELAKSRINDQANPNGAPHQETQEIQAREETHSEPHDHNGHTRTEQEEGEREAERSETTEMAPM